MDVRSLLSLLGSHLADAYSKHGKAYDAKVFYRHRLFALLALCGSYYRMRDQRELYVSIDEAQDLSAAEYSLLRTILDDKTVFNLYGDKSQLVCEYRGISSWDDVSGTVTGSVFELNANYRNTMQITDYCNRELSHSMIGIGLTGKDVTRLHIKDALKKIRSFKAKNSGARVAVVHKRGLTGLRALLMNYEGTDLCWGSVDQSMVSVIDVESSKGLEFEAVVVIENCMTGNERYVSYARAMQSLFTTTIDGLSDVESVSVTSLSHASEPEEEA